MSIIKMSLTTRGMVAPIIGLISTVIIALGFTLTMSSLERQSVLVNSANDAARQIETVLLDATNGTSAFIQTVSFVGAKMEAQRISNAKSRYVESVKNVETNIGRLDFRAAGLEDTAASDLARDLASYKKATQETLDLLDVDIALANMQMLDALTVAAKMEAQLNSTKEAIEAHRAIIEANSKKETTAILLNVMGLVIALGVIGIAVGIAMSRTITKPITKITEVVTALAAGNLNVQMPDTHRQDELGDVIRAVSVFRENAIQVEAYRREQEQASDKAKTDRQATFNQIADRFEHEVLDVVKMVSSKATEMAETARGLAQTAAHLNTEATSVSAASIQTTTSVNTVASAAEELTASIGEITMQVNNSASVSGTASEEIHRTNAMIQELAQASEQIGSVVQLISDIAGQTNLLALNATIEAARAGDAGKGFAVVASEVKSLASQTSRATDEISGQISAIQEKTNNAVQVIAKIGNVIEQVRGISASIASAVEEQGAATNEIARNVQQAAQGTQEVSASIVEVTKIASVTENAATGVLSSADGLAINAEQLQGEVLSFLTRIRSSQ